MNTVSNKWLPLVALGLILFSGIAMAGTPIETTVSRLVTAVHELDARVTSLENHVMSVDVNITQLWDYSSYLNDKINGLQVKSNALETDLNITKLDLTSAQADLSDLAVVVDDLSNQQGLFSQDLNQTQESLSVVTGEVFAVSNDLSAFKDKFVIKQVFDSNSTGWNPGAGVDAFLIPESSITFSSVVSTTVINGGAALQNCYVRGLSAGNSFTLKCNAVPADGAILNYVVMNP